MAAESWKIIILSFIPAHLLPFLARLPPIEIWKFDFCVPRLHRPKRETVPSLGYWSSITADANMNNEERIEHVGT